MHLASTEGPLPACSSLQLASRELSVLSHVFIPKQSTAWHAFEKVSLPAPRTPSFHWDPKWASVLCVECGTRAKT